MKQKTDSFRQHNHSFIPSSDQPEQDKSTGLTVFIHGLGQEPVAWKKIGEILELEQAEYLDLPDLWKKAGFSSDRKLTWSAFYRYFSRHLNTLQGPFHLCGLSLGAELALQYALDHPENVSSLVLAAPVIKAPRALLKIQNGIFRLLPKSQFPETGFSRQDFLSLCASMADLDFSSRMKKLSMPVLLLAGEKDKLSCKTCQTWGIVPPKGQFSILEECGHEINLENPATTAEILSSFWKEPR